MKTLLAVVAVAVSCLAGHAADLTPRGGHPRLFFTAERVAALKERIHQEASSADAWTRILADADQAVQKPETGFRAAEPLALAYRMTGETRYAMVLRDALARELRKPSWGEPDLLKREPVWQAGLGLARSLYSAAVAFDSIHDALTPEERQTFARGIVTLGIRPTLDDWVLGERRIHALDTMGHNWWSACVFVGGIGALAVLDEEPEAGAWLDRISRGSREWFGYAGSVMENKPANFDRAGGFYESVNYASFAMGQYLLFRLAWQNALQAPPADIPLLPKVENFFVDVAYPNSGEMMTVNFGDGSLHADGSRPIALLWANGYRSPSAAWYLAAARKMSYREGLDRTTPLGLLYLPSERELANAPAAPVRPNGSAYGDMGWAMLRSSWQKDATLLAVKSGYTWNHSHADEGSFVLFHRGQYLLIDSGNCSYGRPEYDSYYRQSVAHNVVTFNGRAENPEDTYSGSKFPGTVSHLFDTGDFKYVLADATGPTSRLFNRNYRHFLWVGDVVLVIDDVEAFEPGQFEFLLHVDGKVERRGLDLIVSQGNAAVQVRPLFPETFPDAGLPTDYPEKMRLVEKVGLKDHDADAKVTYYAFAPAEQVQRTKFITAITLVTDQNKDRLPRFERLTGPAMNGVRIQQGEETTDVYLNLRADGSVRHRNANNTLGGWETDAYLLAFTYSNGTTPAVEGARRVFVADGSYLRRDHTVVLDSLSKVFATWTGGSAAPEVVVQGQPVLNVELKVATAPAAISVNGAARSAPFDSARKSVLITAHSAQ